MPTSSPTNPSRGATAPAQLLPEREAPGSGGPAPVPATTVAVVQRRYGDVAEQVLALEEVPVPVPGAGEVLVRVDAAGVDRGVWHLMAGRPLVVRAVFGLRRPKQPVLGMDLAGVVAAVPDGVTDLAVGDAVMGVGVGTYAGYAVAPVAKLARRPGFIPVEQAAAMPISGLTALQAVRREAQVRPGERVLVLGASGGVGTFAVQVAVAEGALVTGVASASKLDLVRALGAEEAVDHTTTDITTTGERFDVIIDIGGNTPIRKLRRALAPEGRLVIVGGEGGGRLLGGVDRQFRAELLSPFVHQRLGFFTSDENRADLEALRDLVVAGQVVPHVGRTYPLADAAQALDDLVSGRVRGKAVLTV